MDACRLLLSTEVLNGWSDMPPTMVPRLPSRDKLPNKSRHGKKGGEWDGVAGSTQQHARLGRRILILRFCRATSATSGLL